MEINHTEIQNESFTVLGYAVRTDGPRSAQDIPALWERVGGGDVLGAVPGRVSDDIHAVYTNLENAGRGRDGWFTFVIGVSVDPSTPIPDHLTMVTVPASTRAVFPAPDDRPERILEAWQAAWSYDDADKTFVCEYERYGADGSVTVNIGLRR